MTLMGRIRRTAALAAILLLILPAGSARASLEEAAEAAANWLESPGQQNPDGSWGSEEEVRFLYTSAVVDALRAYGRRGSAYFRGIAWLENHAVPGVDGRARRIVSLLPNGDDTSADLQHLLADQNPSWGWGLSGAYASSPLDSAVALLAIGSLGASDPSSSTLFTAALSALLYLFAVQSDADGGWPVVWASMSSASPVESDPVVTALVLRAFAALPPGYTQIVQTSFDFSRTDGLAFLESQETSLDALGRAHVALALMKWSPESATAQTLVDTFDVVPPQASWMSDSYATATVLHALAARLGADAPEMQESVFVPDARLKGAINDALARNRLDALTRSDLQRLSSVDLSNRGIEELTGIEEAVNLTVIDLTGNTEIADTTLLYSLAGLPGFVPPTPYCDVGQNHEIDASDGLLALRAVVDAVTLTPTQVFAGDLAPPIGPDASATLTAADALLVLRGTSGQGGVCGDD
jgi:hypothetical protein